MPVDFWSVMDNIKTILSRAKCALKVAKTYDFKNGFKCGYQAGFQNGVKHGDTMRILETMPMSFADGADERCQPN